MKNKRSGTSNWSWIKRVLLFSFAIQIMYVTLLKWIDPLITITQLSSVIRGDGLERDYLSDAEMAVSAKLAVIAAEDQLFADHKGFDWKSIEKALTYNKKKPNRIRGASTISQQVAKNVFLWQGRSWLRKGLEIYCTFLIEMIWNKKRILEMYLNVSEMGRGIFGIEAAAQYYFHKHAISLTRQQAAMIASSLPNPKRFTVKPVSRYVAVKYPWVLRQMNVLSRDSEIQQIIR